MKKTINIAVIEPDKDARFVLESELKKEFKSKIKTILVPYLDYYIKDEIDLYIIIDREILRREHNWQILWEKIGKGKQNVLFITQSSKLDVPPEIIVNDITTGTDVSDIINQIKNFI